MYYIIEEYLKHIVSELKLIDTKSYRGDVFFRIIIGFDIVYIGVVCSIESFFVSDVFSEINESLVKKDFELNISENKHYNYQKSINTVLSDIRKEGLKDLLK